jgi:hypothetical protein
MGSSSVETPGPLIEEVPTTETKTPLDRHRATLGSIRSNMPDSSLMHDSSSTQRGHSKRKAHFQSPDLNRTAALAQAAAASGQAPRCETVKEHMGHCFEMICSRCGEFYSDTTMWEACDGEPSEYYSETTTEELPDEDLNDAICELRAHRK